MERLERPRPEPARHNFEVGYNSRENAVKIDPGETTGCEMGSVMGEWFYYHVNPGIREGSENLLSQLSGYFGKDLVPVNFSGNHYSALEKVISHYCGLYTEDSPGLVLGKENQMPLCNHQLKLVVCWFGITVETKLCIHPTIEIVGFLFQHKDEHYRFNAGLRKLMFLRGYVIAERLYRYHDPEVFKGVTQLSLAEARNTLFF